MHIVEPVVIIQVSWVVGGADVSRIKLPEYDLFEKKAGPVLIHISCY